MAPKVSISILRTNELTPREIQVVALVAAGEPNQFIVEHLGISLDTVKRHLTNVMDKRGLDNRTQLAIWWHTRIWRAERKALQAEIADLEHRLQQALTVHNI